MEMAIRMMIGNLATKTIVEHSVSSIDGRNHSWSRMHLPACRELVSFGSDSPTDQQEPKQSLQICAYIGIHAQIHVQANYPVTGLQDVRSVEIYEDR